MPDQLTRCHMAFKRVLRAARGGGPPLNKVSETCTATQKHSKNKYSTHSSPRCDLRRVIQLSRIVVLHLRVGNRSGVHGSHYAALHRNPPPCGQDALLDCRTVLFCSVLFCSVLRVQNRTESVDGQSADSPTAPSTSCRARVRINAVRGTRTVIVVGSCTAYVCRSRIYSFPVFLVHRLLQGAWYTHTQHTQSVAPSVNQRHVWRAPTEKCCHDGTINCPECLCWADAKGGHTDGRIYCGADGDIGGKFSSSTPKSILVMKATLTHLLSHARR